VILEDGLLARVVIAASSLSGHVLPMVTIGAHLQDLGHHVVVLTDAGHRDVVDRCGLSFLPLEPAGCVSAPPRSPLTGVLPALGRRYLLGKADVRSTFVAPLSAQYRALANAVEGEAADAVLVDLAFTGALPFVLAPRPRPAVLVCGVGPLTLSSTDTPPFGMAWEPRPGMDYSRMQAVVHRVLFGDLATELDAALRDVGAPHCPVPLMDWPRLADRLLQLTVPGFEYPRRDLPPTVEFVGPVLPARSPGFRAPRWLDDVRRAGTVVHVTQGTLDNGDLDRLIGPTLDGLAREDDIAVVATTGRRDGPRLSTTIPANAHVAEWIPYSALLPRVDVMITNGGYGGVHHALSYGVPLIVAGEASDKSEVAVRVEYAGVGLNLKTADPSPRQIAAAVREVCGAPGYREAAARVGGEIAATAPLDRIAAVLDEEVARIPDPL